MEYGRAMQEASMKEAPARKRTAVSLVLEAKADRLSEANQRCCATLSRSKVNIAPNHSLGGLYSSFHSDCAPWRACGRAMSHLQVHEFAIQSP